MNDMAKMFLSRRNILTSFLTTPLLIPGISMARKLGPNEGIKLRDASGESIINDALHKPGYWDGARIEPYKGQTYDEVRLKKLKKGYLCRVSGTGGDNLPAQHVGDTVFWHQNKLPTHMPGAMTALLLDSGHDSYIDAAFTDIYLLGDFDFFYGEYYQRMYRTRTSTGGYFQPFERITRRIAGPEEWDNYLALRDKGISNTKLRMMLNRITLIDEYYGMYIIEPEGNKTRVTLVARLRFGKDAGWLASFASKLPWVLRTGLQNGFNGSVDITKRVKSGEYTSPK